MRSIAAAHFPCTSENEASVADTNRGRRTSVNLFENVRYVRTHLLYGPKTHTNVKPIEDISGSLWNCPLDHAFETIGSAGEDRHAGLFGPAVVLHCRFHEFPSTRRLFP
jgi:hypothetical protein